MPCSRYLHGCCQLHPGDGWSRVGWGVMPRRRPRAQQEQKEGGSGHFRHSCHHLGSHTPFSLSLSIQPNPNPCEKSGDGVNEPCACGGGGGGGGEAWIAYFMLDTARTPYYECVWQQWNVFSPLSDNFEHLLFPVLQHTELMFSVAFYLCMFFYWPPRHFVMLEQCRLPYNLLYLCIARSYPFYILTGIKIKGFMMGSCKTRKVKMVY